MAFQFNFNIEEDHDDEPGLDENAATASTSISEQINVRKENDKCNNTDTCKLAKELYAPSKVVSSYETSVDSLHVGDLELRFLNPDEVEEQLNNTVTLTEGAVQTICNDSDVSRAIESHSDLVPNVYEGGLKVWECSVDLVNYLHDNDIHLADQRVLELGCGAGLPGIYAMKRRAATVHFQDYNEEVIDHMTIPSVMLNIHQGTSTKQELRFFAGDWSLVQEMLASTEPSTRYDIILTSETIYSVKSHEKLYQILRALLTPTGTVYLAAKTHYFGVGGGTRLFEDVVKRHGEFRIEVCKTLNEGVKREILKMAFLNTGNISNS